MIKFQLISLSIFDSDLRLLADITCNIKAQISTEAILHSSSLPRWLFDLNQIKSTD